MESEGKPFQRALSCIAAFDRGAAALRSVYSRSLALRTRVFREDVYACPLCLLAFTRADAASGGLTWEHAPPRGLGGRELVLTCRQCNNAAGSRLDEHARRRDALLDFATGTTIRPLRAVADFGSVQQRVDVSATDSTYVLRGIPAAGHPDVPGRVTDVMDEWRAEWEGRNVRIEFSETFDNGAARLSILRAAYLAAFAHAGYSFVLQPAVQPLRDAVRARDADAIASTSLIAVDARRDRREILYVSDRELGDSLVVQIGRHTVFLPGDGSDAGFFDRAAPYVEEVAAKGLPTSATRRRVGWPTRALYLYDDDLAIAT